MSTLIREGIVLSANAAVTVAVTHPLVPGLSSVIPGDGDAWQFYWSLWWVDRAVLDLRASPFFTPDLYFPYGASLYFHTLNLFPSILVLPIVSTAGLTVAYNALVCLGFVGSAYGTYRLAVYVLGPVGDTHPTLAMRLAAFVAGLVFTFSAYRFVHTLGHLDLVSTQWLPFSVLFLLKCQREPGWAAPVLAALFLTITALTSWYYLLFLLVFAGLLLINALARGEADRRRPHALCGDDLARSGPDDECWADRGPHHRSPLRHRSLFNRPPGVRHPVVHAPPVGRPRGAGLRLVDAARKRD